MALTQSRLREKARMKFGDFARGSWSSRATAWSRPPGGPWPPCTPGFAQAGAEQVVDLGCGIGADSLALAALDRTVTAVERDPSSTAAAATVNLTGWPRACVLCSDAQGWISPCAGEPPRPRGAGWIRLAASRRWPHPAGPSTAHLPSAVLRHVARGGRTRRGREIGPGSPPARARGRCRPSGSPTAGTWWRPSCGSGAARRPDVVRSALVLGGGAEPGLRGVVGGGTDLRLLGLRLQGPRRAPWAATSTSPTAP
ncbi:hypothetical protein QJS66_20845 [Kocuria rhizophila]|nr:hypothetical protein QJS66_20845 [Kocuria rhizophila]